MRYLDVCAGISASTVAWKPLGWQAAAYSEIEAAPRAILAHHYPDTPLHGDFTTIAGDEYGTIDLLVGGTPCQDFSVAGLRAGLAGDRGNLSLQFLLLARRTRARWVVWENVPGVFSSLSHDALADPGPPQIDLDAGDGPEDGQEVVVEDEYDADESHAFASFLAGLSECGYGCAWRVLDAQFAGVPQRRRRVFVVGYLGDWRRAAAVLFERHSLSGHPAPRRSSIEDVAGTVTGGARQRGGYSSDDAPVIAFGISSDCLDRSGEGAGGTAGERSGLGIVEEASPSLRAKRPNAVAFGGNDTRGPIDVSTALNSHGGPCGRLDFESETFVCGTLNANGKAAGSATQQDAESGMLVPVAFDCLAGGNTGFAVSDVAGALRGEGAGGGHAAIAFMTNESFSSGGNADLCPTLKVAGNGGSRMPAVALKGAYEENPKGPGPSAVRRLTPRECERLQGFPDDYTLVPYRKGMMADGPRYKALGNSMAVPVMRWIGERIAAVEAITIPSSVAVRTSA